MRIDEAKLRETIKRLLIESNDPDAIVKMENLLDKLPTGLQSTTQEGNIVLVHSRNLYDSYMKNVASALDGAGGTQFGQNFESILSQAATQLDVFSKEACVDLNANQAGDFEFADVATMADAKIGPVGILYSVKNSSKPQAPTGEITPKQFQKGVLGATTAIPKAKWFAPGFISSFMDKQVTERIGMLGIGFVVDCFIPDIENGCPIAAADKGGFPATDNIPHLFSVEGTKYYPYSKLQSLFYYNFLNARGKASKESTVTKSIYDLPKPGQPIDIKTITEFNDLLIDNYIGGYSVVPMPVPSSDGKIDYDKDGNIIKAVGQKKIFVVKEAKVPSISLDISQLSDDAKYTIEFMEKDDFKKFVKGDDYTKGSQLLTIMSGRIRKPFPKAKLGTDGAQYLGSRPGAGPGDARANASTIAKAFPQGYQNMLTTTPPSTPTASKQGFTTQRVFIAVTPLPPSLYNSVKGDDKSAFNLIKYQVAKLLAMATKQEISVKSPLNNDAQIWDESTETYIAVPSSYMKPTPSLEDPEARIETGLTGRPDRKAGGLAKPDKYIYGKHWADYVKIMKDVLAKYSAPGSPEETAEVADALQNFLGQTSIINENFPTLSRSDMLAILTEMRNRLNAQIEALEYSEFIEDTNESRLRNKILEQISINRPLFDELLVTIKEYFEAILANVEDPATAITYLNNLNLILTDGIAMIKEKQSGQVASGPSLDSININTQDDNMPDNVENLFGPQNQQALPQQNVKSVAEAKLYEAILRKLLAASKKRR